MPNNNSSERTIEGIHCDVSNCRYHAQGHTCTAKEITVGPQYANNSTDTVCATFKPEQSMY